jgi:hypothetical protein
MIIMFPIVLILHFSKAESLSGLTFYIFLSLLLNGVISMISDTLWAKSVLLTSPLIASICMCTFCLLGH